ncbi:MAG: glycosyltransferase family 39 protein [Cyclobacteriaceae bacterium]|nr:glycosyltransferase family 39 protein [Cyclobacteriaceae bacterium]
MTKQLEVGMRNLKLIGDWQLIILFATLKLLLHFITFSNFELHRDAYLYYAQSEHLAWGYISVPPSIAVIGKFATLIFGNTTFGLRFFPALIGAINIVIIGLAVKELGGKKIAITLASLAYLLSPSYLHVNALFQPVSFNHFYWLLSGYLILVMIKRDNPKIWIWIAITFGLAFLNKYSIVFFYTAFAISLLISNYRYLYISKYFIIGLSIGIFIISPNLIWQYQHNWPVLQHMSELRETQLVHVHLSDFIAEQFLMNMQALFLWLVALLVLLFYKKEKQYRLFGFIYIIVIILLMVGSGKSYYSLGIYPILFVFGAYLIEKYSRQYKTLVFSFLIVFMVTSFYTSLSFDGIPLSTFEKVAKKDAFRWEDGKYYDLPQDMADMTGWNELGQKVSDVYLGLSEEKRKNCGIFCDHYGQAGAVMFHGRKVNIPQPISTNGSFVFWAPDSLTNDYIIWVNFSLDNDNNSEKLMHEFFNKVELKTAINNKFFRETGTKIYLCQDPTEACKSYYKNRIGEFKNRYR